MGGLQLRMDLLVYGRSFAAICGLIVLFGVIAGCRYSSSADASAA